VIGTAQGGHFFSIYCNLLPHLCSIPMIGSGMDRDLTIEKGAGQGREKGGYPPSPPPPEGRFRGKGKLNKNEHAEISQVRDKKGETVTWQRYF
jgi:hypothetical protein